MDLPSILRDLKKTLHLSSEDTEEELEQKFEDFSRIFEKWNHLLSDGSILRFKRHYEFTSREEAADFLLNILQSEHTKSFQIDICNPGNKRCHDVIVSVSRSFFETHMQEVSKMLSWIESEYNDRRKET